MPLVDDRTHKLIDTLAACAASCAACSKDCASRGDSELAACIALCNDCAVLCGACIPLIASGSQFSAELCRVCADACEKCADECDRRGMIECAEARRKARRRAGTWPAPPPDRRPRLGSGAAGTLIWSPRPPTPCRAFAVSSRNPRSAECGHPARSAAAKAAQRPAIAA